MYSWYLAGVLCKFLGIFVTHTYPRNIGLREISHKEAPLLSPQRSKAQQLPCDFEDSKGFQILLLIEKKEHTWKIPGDHYRSPNTADGRNPAPVDVENIPFIHRGGKPDFFHPQYHRVFLNGLTVHTLAGKAMQQHHSSRARQKHPTISRSDGPDKSGSSLAFSVSHPSLGKEMHLHIRSICHNVSICQQTPGKMVQHHYTLSVPSPSKYVVASNLPTQMFTHCNGNHKKCSPKTRPTVDAKNPAPPGMVIKPCK